MATPNDIYNEITRIDNAKQGIAEAIEEKGVQVPAGTPIQDFPGKVRQIQTGSPDAVLYTPQDLTPEQQAQARTNIAAASESEVSQLRSDFDDSFNVVSGSLNILNPNDTDIQLGKYLNGNSLGTDDSLDLSGYLPVVPGQTYKMYANILTGNSVRDSTCRYVSYFNASKTYLSKEESVSTFTPPANAVYVRVSIYNRRRSTDPRARSLSDVAIIDTLHGNEYVPYEYVTFPEIADKSGWTEKSILTKNNIQSLLSPLRDKLSGKKWVSCGDSYTKGDFTSLQPSEYQFQDNPYKGENMVYPFHIGRRTGMVVINEAVSGSTMTYIDGTEHEFSTENGRYTQIPADADYITLYFGINDATKNVPLGTIDDNVNTTFYGAWNIVLSYLLSNYPNAKIGIIITNDCSDATFIDAEKALAKKYGIGVLNFADDTTISYVYRQFLRTDIPVSIRNIYDNRFKVSGTNNHPSTLMHERESHIIEEWLRQL